MGFIAAAVIPLFAVSSLYVDRNARRCFVVAFHSLSAASSVAFYDRDSPKNIRKRIAVLAIAVGIGVCVTFMVHPRGSKAIDLSVSTSLTKCLRVTVFLFLGPLFEKCVDAVRCGRSAVIEWMLLRKDGSMWSLLRNVLVAPILEEILFRGIVLAFLDCHPRSVQVVTSAFIFSVCHLHHVVNNAVISFRHDTKDFPNDAYQRELKAWKCALRQTVSQSSICFVFGLLSGAFYVTVAERSIWATAAAHAFCNLIGPPSFRFVSKSSGEPAWQRVTEGAMYVVGLTLCFSMMVGHV